METKHIFSIDLILIVSTSLAILILMGYSNPLVIFPVKSTNNSNIIFSIGDLKEIQIDKTTNFDSSKTYLLSDGLNIDFTPGIYYLKIKHESLSEIITLTVKSKVSLEFKKTQNGYDLLNSGEKTLKVRIHDINTTLDELEISSTKKSKSFWGLS